MDYSRPISDGQRKLVAQGWTWHEQLRDALPPGTDDKEIQRRLERQQELLGKGYIWNDQLCMLVPPGTTQSDIERQLAKRAELAKKAGGGGDLPDWFLIGFLLLFGLAVFGQNPLIGIVVIGLSITGWRMTYGKRD